MEAGSIESTIKIKLPFFILGVLIGQVIVFLTMLWVPSAVMSFKQSLLETSDLTIPQPGKHEGIHHV